MRSARRRGRASYAAQSARALKRGDSSDVAVNELVEIALRLEIDSAYQQQDNLLVDHGVKRVSNRLAAELKQG